MIEMINCAADSVKSVIKGAQLGVSDSDSVIGCDRDRRVFVCVADDERGCAYMWVRYRRLAGALPIRRHEILAKYIQ